MDAAYKKNAISGSHLGAHDVSAVTRALGPNLPLLMIFNVLEGFTWTSLLFVANVIDASIPEAFGLTVLIFAIFSLISWK
ncbi:MAG TPA: hypothetical protein VMT42_05290 [candidate division Zixibacteria bacterium]|nr:hypothetical protein [candidate division Zixibacteria bacterium]